MGIIADLHFDSIGLVVRLVGKEVSISLKKTMEESNFCFPFIKNNYKGLRLSCWLDLARVPRWRFTVLKTTLVATCVGIKYVVLIV